MKDETATGSFGGLFFMFMKGVNLLAGTTDPDLQKQVELLLQDERREACF